MNYCLKATEWSFVWIFGFKFSPSKRKIKNKTVKTVKAKSHTKIDFRRGKKINVFLEGDAKKVDWPKTWPLVKNPQLLSNLYETW